MKNVKVCTAKLVDNSSQMIELLKFNSHHSEPIWNGKPYSTGLTHIAFTVKNIEKTCDELKAWGVSFPDKPQVSLDGKHKVIYAVGPEKVLLELVEEIDKKTG